MSRHTFLFEEGCWLASGYYLDLERRKVSISGRIVVTHGDDEWRSDSRLTLHEPDFAPYLERCSITPLSDERHYADWCAENSLFGRLAGSYAIVEDSILAHYTSQDGRYRGVEYRLRVFDEEYTSRGAIFAEGRRIASWKVELVREKG